MKKVILLIACIALIGLCKAQKGFRITGSLGQLQQDTFYLVVPNLNGTVNVLGVSILKEGNIEFQGQVLEPVMATIMTSDKQGSIPLMLENTDYSIRIGSESIVVEGGAEQAVFNQFTILQREAAQQQQKLQTDMKIAYEEGNQMRVAALSGQGQKFMQNMQKRQMEIVKQNANTSAAAYIVLACGMQAPPEQLQELYNLLGERARTSVYGKVIAAQLMELGKIAEGKVAPDFVMYSPKGETISLYGIKAKVKLLDFWASWCGPCRAENPNVIRLYKKYHSKGLEVVGFSLDDNKSKWVQAIMEDGLPWLNGSDLKGQASEIGRLYNVRSIPFTLLLDENNRIVGKNLRGKELTKKIEELLKSK